MVPLDLSRKHNRFEWAVYFDPQTRLYTAKNSNGNEFRGKYTTKKSAEQALEMYLRANERPLRPKVGRPSKNEDKDAYRPTLDRDTSKPKE